MAIVLTIAVVPMVGMFDALRSEPLTASADYDKARTCAIQKLEQLRAFRMRPSKEACKASVAVPDSDTTIAMIHRCRPRRRFRGRGG